MMRRLIVTLAAVCVLAGGAGLAFAAKGAHPHEQEWSWDGPFGTFDRAAVQRGFAVYKQVCSSCHGMEQLAYRNLGERGGPFVGYEYDGHVSCGVATEHHGPMVDPNDNPCVIAIADDYQISIIDPDTGVETERTARPSDRFRSPYANEALARAGNNGALPPDLSVIISARHYGADYVYALLTGYTGEQRDGKWVNPYMGGELIAMAPPITDDVAAGFTYDDGTPATADQMARDVVTFLSWANDPKQELRKQMGLAVLAFLFVLSVLLYAAYKQVWRGMKH
jgi:ubiquinol-cytochrome c reductase cytochrome c1 subunit